MNEETYQMLMHYIQLFAFSTIVAIFAVWVAQKSGFFRFPRENFPRPNAPSFFSMIGAFIVFLTIELVIVPVLTVLWLEQETGHGISKPIHITVTTEGWLNIMAIGVAAIGIFSYWRLQRVATRNAIWGTPGPEGRTQNILRNYLLGCATWFVGYPIVLALGQVIGMIVLFTFPHAPAKEQVAVKYLVMTASNPFLYFLMALAIVTIVPVVEEMLFRGFLLTWLLRKMGKFKAIGLTAAIFALFHYATSQGVENIELLISLFVLACFLGFLYERQRSLWAPIGLHSFFNATSIIMITLSE